MAPHSQAPFMVTAPGKVIVFGEHASVHGKAVIAAAVSLRSYLLVTPKTEPRKNSSVQLAFPDIGFHVAWPIDELPWRVFAGSVSKMEERSTQLEPHLDKICPPEDNSQKKQMHRSAAKCFLYLLLSICDGDAIPPCSFTLRSNLPTGAGLGSSASISVCIAAAMLYMTGQISTPTAKAEAPSDQRQLSDLDRKQHAEATLVNNWAYVGEVTIHGTPSGVDNTVATFGKAVHFKKSLKPNEPPSIEPIADFPLLPLMIIDTKQSRSTKAEVEKVKRLMDDFPGVTSHMLDAIDEISKHAYSLIKQSNAHSEQDNADMMETLGKLFQINHGILASLGVSHPRLERIRQLIDEQRLGYTKLTGGGGGGCAITLVPSQGSENEAAMENIKRTLEEEGYAIYPTTLGARGAGIWAPETADALPAPDAFATVKAGASDGEWSSFVGDVEDTETWGWRYWIR